MFHFSLSSVKGLLLLLCGFAGLQVGLAQEYDYPNEHLSFKERFAYGCDPEVTGYSDTPSCGVVLAFSGLKLRDQPSFSGKTLAVIPFGATVERTGNAYKNRPLDWWAWPMTPDSIRGYWQEIVWKGKKGYAFSAFIGDAIYRMTEPAYLLFENTAICQNDGYASPDYYYYGIVPNRDSSAWALRECHPTFHFDGYSFDATAVQTDLHTKPAFLLILKEPVAAGQLLAGKFNKPLLVWKDSEHLTRLTAVPKPVALPNSSRQLRTLEKADSTGRPFFQIELSDQQTGQKKIIIANAHTRITVIWAGDLDRDGITDFMLSYESEHQYGCQLFLSKFAAGKKLVWPTRIYWFGDCC